MSPRFLIMIICILLINPLAASPSLKFLEDKPTKDETGDISMNFDEIVTRKKYPLLVYYVTTDDGYVLKLYRIPGPKDSPPYVIKDPNRKVVLLQHGLLDSSDSWVSNHEHKALAFILANLGFDVWLGNNRGNKHSRNHISLDPNKDHEYWHFSFHEMGIHDVPTFLDFITEETGREKITYIGHSQGTAQLFAGLTIKPDYFKSKLNAFFAFGPITNMKNIGSTFLKILAVSRLDYIFYYLKFHEILQNGDSVDRIQSIVCKYVPKLCSGLLDLIAEVNVNDDDLDRFLVFLAHFPSGTSLRTLQHFADNIRHHHFTQLDNKEPYILENIKDFPIHLFVGKDDRLATVADNEKLSQVLSKNNALAFHKNYDKMGHVTFFLSKTNAHLKDLLPMLEKVNDN